MSIEFKSPTTVGDEYLKHLKLLKPEVDTSRQDSDWWVRSRALGGVISGVYADQKKIADDAFPLLSREEALEKHLNTYFGSGFIQPTLSSGTVGVTGTIGSSIPAGTDLIYSPNGNAYKTSTLLNFTSASALTVAIASVSTGQAQNLLQGANLLMPSPPPGVTASVVVVNGAIGGGKDRETKEEAALRITNRLQNPPSGGTENDYKTWAKEADPSVTDVNVLRFLYGPGTVGVIVAAGTSDIDTAVDNNQAVVRVPNSTQLAAVRDYVNAKKPLTDCAFYLPAVEVPIDVTIRVRYTSGLGSTIQAGQTLTQDQLVQREIKRAIYKTPPGGRRFGGIGYILASEIEEAVDAGLSSLPYQAGNYAQILSDRQLNDLSATGVNRTISELEIPIPGIISVVAI